MNWAHLHLLLNHAPVIGSVFCIFLLIVAYVRRSGDLQKVSLWSLVAVALVALPVYFTGDPAEHMLKGVPGVELTLVHAHEDMAGRSLIVIEILGLAALVGGIVYRRADVLPRWVIGGLLVGSLAVAVLMGITASLGGEIHHPEIRSGGVSTGQGGSLDDDDGRVYRRDGGR